LPTLFLISDTPIKEFINASKYLGILHLFFGIFFLAVLFYVGFLSIWIFYSIILWSVNFFIHSIGYIVKGSEDEQKIVKQVKRMPEINTENEDKGDLKIEDSQAKSEFITIPLEENFKTKTGVISESKPKEPLLTREDFELLLKSSGLTIKQFAEKIGISRQTVSYIIHGKRKITMKISEKAKGTFGHMT